MDTQEPSTSRDGEKISEFRSMCHKKYNSLLKENVSKEEFTRQYRQFCDAEWKGQQFYFVILNELNAALMTGDMVILKKLETFIAYIRDIETESKLRNFYDSTSHELRYTNPVIVACKHKRVGILKYILSSEILCNLSSNTERNGIAINDKDSTRHNAFYYSVRSNNVELIDMLIDKWPGGPSTAHSLELEALSNAYEELRLKNVGLSHEMTTYVEDKLIEFRFFSSDEFPQSPLVNNNFANIVDRIQLVIEYVRWLVNDYPRSIRVDQRFMYLAMSVLQNIHILKQQLKSTYNKIPWEEMEFCLTSFLYSHLEQREINLFYRVTFNKIKILRYLKDFAEVLENEEYFALFTDLPKEEPEIITARIIKTYPRFKELYADHRQIRDVYSLHRMNYYIITSALSADPREKSGQLTILRALHVVADCLKNTLESPKLSATASKFILLLFSEKTRKVVMDLRDSTSPADSLALKIRIEENADVKFFVDVQNDMDEVSVAIDGMFQQKKVEMTKVLLEKIVNSESLTDIQEAINAMTSELNTNDFENIETDNVEVLIKELDNVTTHKIHYEEWIFNEIFNAIEMLREPPQCKPVNYWRPFDILKCVSLLLSNKRRIEYITVQSMKAYAEETLKYLMTPADSPVLKNLSGVLSQLLSSVEMRIRNDDYDLKIRRIICKLSYCVESEAGTNKRIDRLWAKLMRKAPFGGTPLYKSKMSHDTFLAGRMSELKCILIDNALMSNLHKNAYTYLNNKRLQSVIEMLVLDVLNGLDDRLDDNLFFFDDSYPMLTGKCLRDYLARDNTLVNVLLSESVSTTMVLLNAAKLVSEDVIKNKRRLGGRTIDDRLELRDMYDERLMMLTLQEEMFASLEELRADDFSRCIVLGTDVYGRDFNSWTALHYSVSGSNTEMVDALIHCGINVNVTDLHGQSLLHVAAEKGEPDTVRFLTEGLCVDVNVMDVCRRTPLHVAVEHDHLEVVEILLANHARQDVVDICSHTPLYYAVKNNNMDIVKTLIEYGADMNINEMFTPLHMAAELGHVEIVNFLIDNKANVGVTCDMNLTPMHLAAFHGHLNVVQALIWSGADVNACVVGGYSPLFSALEKRHVEIAEVLLAHGADPNVVHEANSCTALHYAAINGITNLVPSLLKYGAEPDIMSVTKSTPLHCAAECGHFDVVDILIDHGVDVNVENNVGCTPLYYAAKGGYKEIVELMVKHGAKINVKNSEHAPLHGAAEAKQLEVVKFLIKNKANVNLRVKNGMTPLHVAASTPGNEDVIKLLKNNKASVNIKTGLGITPLHMAVQANCVGNASLLIEYKADINAETKERRTPLHLAISNGHKEMVELLLAHNADMNVETSGWTPMHYAIFCDRVEIVEILFKNGAVVNDKKDNIMLLENAIQFNCKEIVELLMENGIYELVSGGCNAMAQAVTAGYTEIVEIFLRHGVPVNERYPQQNTILHTAARTGYVDIVDVLISNGADVNATYGSDITPIHIAAREGHDKVVRSLVTNGATVNVKSSDGDSPLHLATEMGHSNVVKILLDNGASIDDQNGKNRTPLELAVTYDRLEIVQILLEYQKFDLNADYNGTKLLHIASCIPSLEMVKYLVDEGADVYGTNSISAKAIHVAGDKDITEYFLAKGLSVDEVDVRGKTPLHCAVQKGLFEVVQCLIDHGADVNAKNKLGTIPLHLAVKAKSKDIIEMLLRNGAMYNCANKSNVLPSDCTDDEHILELLTVNKQLFEAVERNDANSARKSIKAGAVVNVRDADDATPLHYAAQKGYDAVACILLENGADPDGTSNGRTPLHHAAEFSHLETVTILLSKGATYNVLSVDGRTPLDLAIDNDVRHLLTLISKSFKKVKRNDASVILELQQIKDIEKIKAVMNARDDDGETLVVAAIHSNFSNVDMLKEVLEGNASERIAAGAVLLEKGDYKGAFDAFMNAYERRRSMLGPENPATLDVRTNMARALYKQKLYSQALPIYEDIFKKQNETLGSHDRSTLKTRSMIALILSKLKRYEETLNTYRDIYQKQEETLGADHEDTVNTQIDVAFAFAKVERLDEALETLKVVLEKMKNKYGMNHSHTTSIQTNIAIVLDKQGKCNEALKMFEEILEKKRAIYGIDHANTFDTLYSIATLYSNQNQYQEALNSYQELVNLQNVVLGPDHPHTLNTYHHIIGLHVKNGKRFAALKICLDVFPRMQAVLRPSDPVLSNTLKFLYVINLTFKFTGLDVTTAASYTQAVVRDAATTGRLEFIESMVSEGFDLNDNDADGKTPLHHAASGGQPKIVEYLLENNASVNVASVEGKTPLHVASENGRENIVELLLQYVRREKLSDFINARTGNGATSLHIAAKNGFFDIAVCLLGHGAIYNIEDKDGRTPCDLSEDDTVKLLHLTDLLFNEAKKGETATIGKLRVLKESQPKIFSALTNARNAQGNTILQVAISNRHKNFASELLQLLK